MKPFLYTIDTCTPLRMASMAALTTPRHLLQRKLSPLQNDLRFYALSQLSLKERDFPARTPRQVYWLLLCYYDKTITKATYKWFIWALFPEKSKSVMAQQQKEAEISHLQMQTWSGKNKLDVL